jgi:hypothetical protein
MKHLSETPLPDTFPKNVRDALGNVAYDKDKLPTTTPVTTPSASPTPSPSASPSMSAEEMVMADPSTSPTPLTSTQPSSSPSPMSSLTRNSVSSKKKTITCVKNGKTIKVTGKNPKCPIGYKIKR